MRIDIQNDNQKLVELGQLVLIWIDNEKARPTTIGALKDQMREYSVVGAVDGADDRGVTVYSYSDSLSAPLVIPIPSPAMRDHKLGIGQHPAPYPYTVMPSFLRHRIRGRGEGPPFATGDA